MLVLVLLLAALLLLIVAGLFAAGSHIERSEKLVSIVISVVGSLLTFVGLVFAGLQIRAGAQQLEASSIYAMQKDGREIFEKSMANTAYVDFVFHFSPNKTYDASTKEFARRQIGLII
jgi:hypothetical protein